MSKRSSQVRPAIGTAVQLPLPAPRMCPSRGSDPAPSHLSASLAPSPYHPTLSLDWTPSWASYKGNCTVSL